MHHHGWTPGARGRLEFGRARSVRDQAAPPGPAVAVLARAARSAHASDRRAAREPTRLGRRFLAGLRLVDAVGARTLTAALADAHAPRLALDRIAARHAIAPAVRAAVGPAIALFARLGRAVAAIGGAVGVVLRAGAGRTTAIAVPGRRDRAVRTVEVAIERAAGRVILGAGVTIVAALGTRVGLTARFAGLGFWIDDSIATCERTIVVVADIAVGRAAVVVVFAGDHRRQLAAHIAGLGRARHRRHDTRASRGAVVTRQT
jgi:hypothetical protein